MANINVPLVCSFLFIIISSSLPWLCSALSVDYYHQTCPRAEEAVAAAVERAMKKDRTVPAALLRMHFHDCFVRGCDGSVLLDSTKKKKAEKEGPANLSLHAFYVIDNAKEAVEEMCPGVVSCADILALAARDAVALSGGPSWEVAKGRKDGRVSNAGETIKSLPAPAFNFSQLRQSFSQRGLSVDDLVALSGGHSLGFSHCSSFQNRIHNFDAEHDVDPSLRPAFAAGLRRVCPAHNRAANAGAAMDSTAAVFDNAYYRLLLQGESLFSSDQALLSHPAARRLVSEFAGDEGGFFEAFSRSMVKMGGIPGDGQEVRLNCRVVR